MTITNYACPVCGSAFTTIKELSEHVASHAEEETLKAKKEEKRKHEEEKNTAFSQVAFAKEEYFRAFNAWKKAQHEYDAKYKEDSVPKINRIPFVEKIISNDATDESVDDILSRLFKAIQI